MKKKKKMGIYKITNKINNKSYIGQSIDISKRWRNHVNYEKKYGHYPIYRAIEKYGLENFSFEILEIINNRKDLTNREEYWYEKVKPEYNQVKPSETILAKPVSVYKIDIDTLEIIKKYDRVNEAAKDVNGTPSNISNVCRGFRSSYKGYYWCRVYDYDNWKHKIPKFRKVLKLDLKTKEVLEEYKSTGFASRKTGISQGNISSVANGKRKSAGGYIWVYKDLFLKK